MNERRDTVDAVMPHLLTLDDCHHLTATGVSDVDSFDEQTVKACTSCGTLTVRGDNLHISRLNLESGELSLDGTVRSMTYENLPTRADGGLLRRLFR